MPLPPELRRRLEALGVRRTEALGESLARLAADGAPEELLAPLGQAAREREAAARGEGDGARSQAERFLRLLLETHPATHGLFELNARADFLLNGRPVEVDFLCRRLRVALEVDGSHHFQSAQAYRRDRRKDVALQRHGYLVLRFLADDVVERVQETRDTLLGKHMGERVKEPVALEKMKPMLNEARGPDFSAKIPHQATGEFHVVRAGRVQRVKADASALLTEQLPDDELLRLAASTLPTGEKPTGS